MSLVFIEFRVGARARFKQFFPHNKSIGEIPGPFKTFFLTRNQSMKFRVGCIKVVDSLLFDPVVMDVENDSCFSDFDVYVEENEIILSSPAPVQEDVAQRIEFEMWNKYGVDAAFMAKYIDFASKRNALEVLQERYLLPDKRMDRAEMVELIKSCVASVKKFDDQKKDFKAVVRSNYLMMKEMRDAAVNDKERDLIGERMKKVVTEYHAFMSEGTKAWSKLHRVSQYEPIDAVEFHRDMQSYIKAWTAAKLRVHFPLESMDLV